jgi:hypothetical protein
MGAFATSLVQNSGIYLQMDPHEWSVAELPSTVQRLAKCAKKLRQ